MTEQEKIYFTAFSQLKSRTSDALENDPTVKNMMNSFIDKNSEQAHFVYELLQNADDVGAESVHFELHEDKLIFIHNGNRRFSVSDPATMEEDRENGKLGDINAISGIYFSSKITASIGKFGIGFKTVFIYTKTPHVYDPGIFFKIERYMVPVLIKDDFPGRKQGETLFVFPFDNENKKPNEAFSEIAEKLQSLVFPILFLNNLKKITYTFSSTTGSYSKLIEKELNFNTTIAQCISFVKKYDEKTEAEKLWLFSRLNENNFTYCVGFFLNKDGALSPKNCPAFCFFPTRETTGLEFVVHAPFLLNDSREGIKAGERHNTAMIKLLADLAADSLAYLKEIGLKDSKILIDDNIFDIIPYYENKFSDINDKTKISFKPFYTAIRNKFLNDALLPSVGGYVKTKNAYWASVPRIAELFDNHLASLTQNGEARWVFRSFGRGDVLRKNKPLTDYIDSITNNWINEDDIIINGWSKKNEKGIGFSNSAIIGVKNIQWLHSFYKWISETERRIEQLKNKPIFLDRNDNAVSARDEEDKAILFLPMDNPGDYKTIKPELLNDPDTYKFITKNLGIARPSLHDEIHNIIIPQYNDNADINTEPHFKKFFEYYKKCPTEDVKAFIADIKNCPFIYFSDSDDTTIYRGMAEKLYLPTPELRLWFEPKPSTNFVRLDDYKKLINGKDENLLLKFFGELGVKDRPGVCNRNLTYERVAQLFPGKNWPQSSRDRNWSENYIGGCAEIIDHIIRKKDRKASVILWENLLALIAKHGKINNILRGTYTYFNRSDKYECFDSSDTILLQNEPWILNNAGELVSANGVTIQTLSAKYDTQSIEVRELLSFLNIRDETVDNTLSNLTPEQRTKLKIYDEWLKDLQDLSTDEQEELKKTFARIRAKRNGPIVDVSEFDSDNAGKPLDRNTAKVVKDVASKVPTACDENAASDEEDDSESNDEDEYTKPSVDYSKKIEKAKNKSAAEIRNIERLDELDKKARESKKYSFGWFLALLELEQMNSAENLNSREISISFGKVEREADTARTLVLKRPNRFIPISMEELENISLELYHYEKLLGKPQIEVVSVKSNTLRAKLKSGAEIDGIDLSLVTEARISAQNPVFLLKELLKAFNALGYDNDFDMQKNLCQNIEFVFGPPGTGKTTYLAKNVIIPIMKDNIDKKILVLTPTNKAADVIVSHIMKNMGDDTSYQNWLVRFGTTYDSAIEQSGVFREKTFDIRSFPRNVTVTTIARFPYDFFMPEEGKRLHLNGLKWDYIIIDEASMVSLAYIVYSLYKKEPEKFIIAGDPFQIGPITSTNLWKDENIYTMVGLKSFADPKTIPHDYHVELLTTQYRSIPDIGEVFSHFAYDGVLQHHRGADSQKQLFTGSPFDIKSLNIIKFPVSKYESIYRPKKILKKSNYQIYSALFTFEFAKWLSGQIAVLPQTQAVKIGIIAPYRVQADLLDRLFSSVKLPPNIDVQVGTIHGFQGDECDIIIAVFNPPPSISDHPDMFLQKKNIINVSISRARDYLFVVMPDDKTENVRNLKRVKKVEQLCKGQSSCSEIHSNDIEKFIFGKENYLEDNSFSTNHQNVNVYGEPEKKYEIRSEDTAVDIQVHMEKR